MNSKQNLSYIQGFIFDIDGVIFRGDALIDGALETLTVLKSNHIPYIFVSNHTIYTKEQYLDKLRKIGLSVGKNDLLTANDALIFYIRHHFPQNPGKIFLVGTQGMKEAMVEGGFEISDKNPDFVVVGVNPQVTHEELVKAIMLVKNGAKLIVAGPDRMAVREGGFDLGSGTIGATVAHGAHVVPVYAAKPFEPIITEALGLLQLPKEKVAIVGDTLETDIAAKYQVGLGLSILVLSGNTKEENVKNIPEERKPDIVLPSIKELKNLL